MGVDYQKREGDCRVPQQYAEVAGLGNWVVRQRASYKREDLSEERIGRLNALGFVWEARSHEEKGGAGDEMMVTTKSIARGHGNGRATRRTTRTREGKKEPKKN